MLLNRDWNGNGVGNKGVKIRIKSELCTLRFLSSRLRLSYPTVDVQRCVISFMYFFSLPVLNSLWHSCISLWVSWFSYSHNKSTEGGRRAGPETQSSRTWRVLLILSVHIINSVSCRGCMHSNKAQTSDECDDSDCTKRREHKWIHCDWSFIVFYLHKQWVLLMRLSPCV